jgi:hypothetical protein
MNQRRDHIAAGDWNWFWIAVRVRSNLQLVNLVGVFSQPVLVERREPAASWHTFARGTFDLSKRIGRAKSRSDQTEYGKNRESHLYSFHCFDQQFGFWVSHLLSFPGLINIS